MPISHIGNGNRPVDLAADDLAHDLKVGFRPTRDEAANVIGIIVIEMVEPIPDAAVPADETPRHAPPDGTATDPEREGSYYVTRRYGRVSPGDQMWAAEILRIEALRNTGLLPCSNPGTEDED